VINILFVCMGNICRSPTAEIIFGAHVAREGLSDLISVDSAGTGNWHVGNPPDDRAINIAKLLGHEIGHLEARQVRINDFGKFDYILAMDKSNLYDLTAMAPESFGGHLSLLLDFSNEESGDVPDPYYGDLSDYDRVIEMVDPASAGLLRHIRNKHEF